MFLTGKKLRRFFASILLNGAVENPLRLWELFKEKLSDDFRGQDKERNFRRAVYHIHKLLQWRGRSLADFGLMALISDDEIARMDNYQREADERFEITPTFVDNRVSFSIETLTRGLGSTGNRRIDGGHPQRWSTSSVRRNHDCHHE